jgi:tRNA-dihydrouridine synthase
VGEAEVLDAFLRYTSRELDGGAPLRAMTRHLSGMRSGRPGGRRWRRELGELGDGRDGFHRLRRLIDEFVTEPIRCNVAAMGHEFAFGNP